MSYSIGGGIIKRMTLTKAWGLSPASAEIEAVGTGLFQPGSEVVLNVGSSTFFGVVGNCVEKITDQGRFLSVTVPDNRIKLMQDTVYGSFNSVEILEDNVDTPGIDRLKRYVHVYPFDWDAQKKTRTAEPHTAEEILRMFLSAPTVSNGWSLGAHSRLGKPVYGVDASRGKKLGNIVQEVIEEVGLMMTLVGSSALGFAVKGEDTVPLPPGDSSVDISDGVALGPDTLVRIVGDRSLYQDLPIDLEPDWNPVYESFIFEPAWIAKVKSIFGGDDGEAKAKSLTATLRECGIGDDFGKWGEVSRMEIPVWIYLHDIVFKSYRVPRDYRLNGLDLDSLDLRDGLIAQVEGDLVGNLSYRIDNYYPDTKAYCIARGQQLSRLDAKFLDSITIDNLTGWRTQWEPVNKFNLDTKNKTIIFEDPIFIDDGLFVAPNAGTDVSGQLQHLVVPNANVKITAAPVRASLCFAAEVYSKWFGSGTRASAVYVANLNYHSLMVYNAWSREILYVDDKGADAKAYEAGNAALTGQNFLQSGGFTRIGSAGMALNGSIDRITVQLQFEGGGDRDGITEQIDYAKERAPIHFEAERELERRGKVPDALKKIREQQIAADQVRFTAKYLKPVKRQTERPYQNLNSVMQTPVGAVHAGTQTFSSTDTWLAGQPVFVDASGAPASAGTIFRGIVIADQSTGPSIATATQGTVPVRVKGPFTAGDDIGIDPGHGQTAKKDGKLPIGKVNASYSGSSIVTVPVRLGAGSGSASTRTPFLVYESFDNSVPPYPILKVYPGRIAEIIPTLAGAKLDVSDDSGGSHPWFYSPTGNYSLFLKAEVDNTVPDSNFQSHIQSVSVLSDDDPLVIPDIDGITGEVPELKMTWTGTPTEIADRVKGHFYIRIADIKASTVGGNIVVNNKQQELYNSYRTFVIAGDEVIILA